jgi:hypothetical protein
MRACTVVRSSVPPTRSFTISDLVFDDEPAPVRYRRTSGGIDAVGATASTFRFCWGALVSILTLFYLPPFGIALCRGRTNTGAALAVSLLFG